MRHQGRISNWMDDKGYGFISPDGGGKSVFVHINAFHRVRTRPFTNAQVAYELSSDPHGRARAAKVTFAGRDRALNQRSAAAVRGVIALLFLLVLTIAFLLGKLALEILLVYAAVSAVTLLVYGFDKLAAAKDHQRTPENTLHLLAVAGGWPGALLAQQLFRHKSSKQSFQSFFRVTVALNLLLLGWLYTPAGTELLRNSLDRF